MNRAGLTVAVSLVAVTLAGGTLLAQSPMASVLAGKKLTPPIKGQADVEFTKANIKKDKELVVAKFYVKNVSAAPIARLTVNDTWYDDKGAVVTGGRGVIQGLLQPGEVKEMVVETTWNAKMKTNQWSFSHANGNVVPKGPVDAMEGLPEGAMIGGKVVKAGAPAAKASAAKAPAAKKKK